MDLVELERKVNGIDPKQIYGNWCEGWSLNVHTISSIYIGENQYGHPQFDTIRSKLGQQIYLLKNRGKIESVEIIIEIIRNFLESWDKIQEVDVVIPVPPTEKNRTVQPVFLIAKAIADCIGKRYIEDVLEKTTKEQSKNMDIENKGMLKGSVVAKKKATRKHNVLLIDDLVRSGATLRECVEVLKRDDNIDKIYVLVMTRNRR